MDFIAHPQKWTRDFEPSFPSHPSGVVDIHEQTETIEGWLAPVDSMKLYELGAAAPAPFLEIGTYRGRSTVTLATAIRDSDRDVGFWSCDIDGEALRSAAGSLAERGLAGRVTLVHGSVHALLRALPELKPGFVFLDGDHTEAGVTRDLQALESRVVEGGLLLFHDFFDDRNDDPANKDYGIGQAIDKSWVRRDCEFAGCFGTTGLFRRLEGGPRANGVPVLDLMGMDRLSLRLLVQVARPAKRAARRLGQAARGARGPSS